MLKQEREEFIKKIGKLMLLNEDRCRQYINSAGKGKINYKILWESFRDSFLEGEIFLIKKETAEVQKR